MSYRNPSSPGDRLIEDDETSQSRDLRSQIPIGRQLLSQSGGLFFPAKEEGNKVSLGQHPAERNQDATVYVGNSILRSNFLFEFQLSKKLLWESFVQAGPDVNIYVPKDRVTNLQQTYGFFEFRSEEDADYAIKVLNMIKLYGKPIRVNKASQEKKSVDVGANLFIGIDPDVDEKLLYDTFSAFGVIAANPKIMRDPDTGNSRGSGFISYDSFEASNAAIEAPQDNKSLDVGANLFIGNLDPVSNSFSLGFKERH